MSSLNFRTALFPAVALLGLTLTGCISDSHEDHHDDHHEWEHACEHAGDTPVAVTASLDTATAPLAGAAHTLYTVTFAAGARVKLSFEEHGDFGFFLTKNNVPVVLTTATGDTIGFEESVSPLEGCAELAVMHVAHVEEGVHYLTFGSSTETSVGLLVEELAHEDH